MPEIGLGIGCERQIYGNWKREWLYWYEHYHMRYRTSEEISIQERQQKEKLASYLRSIGINPDEI